MVGVLLLVQWLVAAHACMPAAGRLGAPATALAAEAALMAAPHCHDAVAGIQEAAPDLGLCLAHCTSDDQAPTATAAADLATPALGWCLVMSAALPAPPAATVAALAAPVRAGAPPGWPPIYLRNGVLRN